MTEKRTQAARKAGEARAVRNLSVAVGLSAVGLTCGLATVAASEGADKPIVTTPTPRPPVVSPREIEQIDQEVDVPVPVPRPPKRAPGSVPGARSAASGPSRASAPVAGTAAGSAVAAGSASVAAAPAPAAAAPKPRPTAVSTGSQPR
jgi:hypothetical protein